ncbi:MAG: class I SAM-dependent methyltransferase, partial [Solirubrobacteraceae bacterium]
RRRAAPALRRPGRPDQPLHAVREPDGRGAATGPPLSTFLDLWFDHIVPVLGRVAGDAEAYNYLPSSVRRFPGPEALAEVMWRRGLRPVRYVITAGGIIALHVGEVVR